MDNEKKDSASDGDGLLSQSELDKLIASQSGASGGTAPEPEAKVDQGASEEAGESSPLLDQAELDALVAQASSRAAAPKPGPPAGDEGGDEEPSPLLDQAELDALIAQATEGEARQEISDEEEPPPLLDQAELDALVAQASAQAGRSKRETVPPGEADAEGPPALLDQAELDALVAEASGGAKAGGEAAAGEAPPSEEAAPKPETTESKAASVALGQDELDALLTSVKEGGSGPEGEPEREAEFPGAQLDQSELDALVAQVQAEREGPSSSEDVPIGGETDDSSLLISQAELDRLVAESGYEEGQDVGEDVGLQDVAVLTEEELDQVLNEMGKEGPLDESSLDEEIAPSEGVRQVGEPSRAEAGEASKHAGLVEQSAIDALVAATSHEGALSPEEKKDRVGSENLAAAAPADGGAQVSDELIQSLLSDAEQVEEADAAPAPISEGPPVIEEPEEAVEAAFSAEGPRRGKRFRKSFLPGIPELGGGDVAKKAAGSLAAGLVATVATFLLLSLYQERAVEVGVAVDGTLRQAIENAEEYIKQGHYQEAVDELDPAIERVGFGHPDLADAEFTRLAAKYKGLPKVLSSEEVHNLPAEIDAVVGRYPFHEKVVDALLWKARVYAAHGLPHAAASIYEKVLSEYFDAPNRDQIRIEAAELAIANERYQDVLQQVRRLSEESPNSPLLGEGMMLKGEAYQAMGRVEEAAQLFAEVAAAHPDSILGARAAARLGEIALAEGRIDDAIDLLEARDRTATVIDGSDEVLLELAQAYRMKGELDEAEQTLRDLTGIFPADSARVPEAFVELTQLLEAQGKRADAQRLASQAGRRYPNNPLVRRNEAHFLVAVGKTVQAAEALVAAEKAGANDPGLLLEAARYYREANEYEQALEVYERLAMMYPTTPEAFSGRVDMAQVYYGTGEIRRAVDYLEDLLSMARDRPERLVVMLALGDMYDRLGFRDACVDIFERVASVATGPEHLARAAMALLRNDASEEGLLVANRVDSSRLDDSDAYQFLNAVGEALLSVNPARGMDYMQQAHDMFPDQRADGCEQMLMKAYLNSDRAASAQRLLASVQARIGEDPAAAGHLRDITLAWGDYLYDRGDYRAAAEAYEKANGVRASPGPDSRWGAYQLASSLLHLDEYERALPMLDQVAASDSPWAEAARLQAAYARGEQRLAGRQGPMLAREGI